MCVIHTMTNVEYLQKHNRNKTFVCKYYAIILYKLLYVRMCLKIIRRNQNEKKNNKEIFF